MMDIFMWWFGMAVLVVVLTMFLVKWYYMYTAAPVRWPRTWKGWKTLWWLFLNRCPVHHTPLREDPWMYGNTSTLFCFEKPECEGVSMWPGSMIDALRGNHFVWKKEQEAKNV